MSSWRKLLRKEICDKFVAFPVHHLILTSFELCIGKTWLTLLYREDFIKASLPQLSFCLMNRKYFLLSPQYRWPQVSDLLVVGLKSYWLISCRYGDEVVMKECLSLQYKNSWWGQGAHNNAIAQCIQGSFCLCVKMGILGSQVVSAVCLHTRAVYIDLISYLCCWVYISASRNSRLSIFTSLKVGKLRWEKASGWNEAGSPG